MLIDRGFRYILGQQTLFPEEVFTYDAKVIKELLNNCIVHSDYRLRGKINVEEFEDRLVFINVKGYLEKFGDSKASEITEAVEDALPGQLSKMQKSRKVSNILQKMKKNGMADTKGKGAGALWFILYN